MLGQNIWFLLFLADVFLVTFIGLFAFYTYYKKLGQINKIQADAHLKSQEIIEQSNKRSQDILEKVEQKADQILTHSELFKNDLNSSFKTAMQQAGEKYLEMVEEHSKKFIADYENLLTSVKNESLKKTGQALENIENEIKKELEESKVGLKTEMMKSLAKANEEIKEYKIKEFQQIDQEINNLVVQMAKDLLRMNLTPKDHKKLVMQALEKAKEQGMFFL